MPTARDFRRYFEVVDVVPLLGKFGAFGHFEGTVASYPGWRENFYRMVHVQAVPLIHKVNALEQGVSQEVKRKLFKDLGCSAADYIIRIKRLEKEYGGSGKHVTTMIERIKAIGEIGKNYEKVRDAAFALERFLDSNFCKDPHDPVIAEIIRPYMSPDVREQYRAFYLDNRLNDDPTTIYKFLIRMLDVKDYREGKGRDKESAKKASALPPKRVFHKKTGANRFFFLRARKKG